MSLSTREASSVIDNLMADDAADLLGIQESKSAQNQKKADFDELVKNVLRDYKEIADESKDR